MYSLAIGKITRVEGEKTIVTEYTVEGGYAGPELAVEDNLNVIFEEISQELYVIIRDENGAIEGIGLYRNFLSNDTLKIMYRDKGIKYYDKS